MVIIWGCAVVAVHFLGIFFPPCEKCCATKTSVIPLWVFKLYRCRGDNTSFALEIATSLVVGGAGERGVCHLRAAHLVKILLNFPQFLPVKGKGTGKSTCLLVENIANHLQQPVGHPFYEFDGALIS